MTSFAAPAAKQRVRFWDIAKGLAILLVVIGHAANVDPVVRMCIFSFHMPFFFIANGYFIKSYDLRRTVKRGARTLLLPYAVICLLSAVCCVLKNADRASNYLVFARRIGDMFVGMSKISTLFRSFESVWLVWFVICLFAARVIYTALMRLLEKAPAFCAPIVMLALAAGGWALGRFVGYLPWSLDVALVSLPFLWIGDRMKALMAWRHWPWAAVAAYLVWLGCMLAGIQLELATRSYPYYYLCLVPAAAGSFALVGLSQVIERYCRRLTAFFAWCGRNSMILLALHCLEMRFFNWDDWIFAGLPFRFGWFSACLVKLLFLLLAAWIVVRLRELIRYLDASAETADTGA